MRAVTRKLKSQKGISILYALLLFLVCAFVAAATLTAAYNTAARSTQANKAQQAYLTVSSAAELIKAAVEEKSIAMKYITTTVESKDEATGEVTTSTTYSTEVGRPYSGDFAVVGTVTFALFEHSKMGYTKPAAMSYNLDFALEGDYSDLENVAGTLTIGEDYGVTVVIYNKENKGNALRIVCDASTSESSGGSVQTTTVTWGTARITPTTTT